ncbi:XrtA/PEP-CTERM system TPR-repeat protein PrsT [Pseudorhodoferax sp.]|uniref:XrtA/PEP-CTERM system TPR-repeat protein PrsT n=1 Tax=Pseudorhodoferax sp. TaxID=1993553 RepID=UPI0039E3D9AF
MLLNKSSFASTAVAVAAALLLVACGDSPDKLLASAKDYMAKNDTKAAVIQIKNVLQKQPDSAEARYLLGTALLASGDPSAAEIELQKARDLKYDDNQVVPKLAMALVQQGKARKVLDDFASVQLSSPSAVADLQTSLGGAYSATGNQQAAREALNKALAADPQNAVALLAKARYTLADQDVDGALAQVDALLARDPKNAEAWRFKGDLQQYVKRQPDEAVASYRKAIEAKPTDARGYFGLVGLLTRQGKLEDAEKELVSLRKIAAKHPETMYLDAQLSYAKRDFPKAREQAQELLRLAPSNPRALELSGGIELQRNALATAEEYLTKAVQAAPNLPMARRWLAMTYLRSGQPGKAQATLAPIVNDQTADPALLALAGEVQMMNGDARKAEELFARASKLDPEDGRKRTMLAVTQMASGQMEAGLEQLQDIAATDKGTSADMALISAYMRGNELDKALKALDGLAKKTPDNPAVGQLRSRVLLAKGDRDGARKSLEASLARSPNYFPSIASLAALDMQDQKPDEARKRFEELLKREPKSSRALVALAELRARDGGPNAAKEVTDLLNRAIAAEPTEPAPRVFLVDHLLRQQDAKQAVSVAQSALAALPDDLAILDAAGRAQLAAGDTNQGLTTLARVASLQPRVVAPLLRLADAQLAAKNASAAEQTLRKVWDLQPNNLDAFQRMIGIRLTQDRLPDAISLARTVQKQQPKQMAGFLLEGDARASKKDFDGAVAAYQNGLKAAPASPDLMVRLHSTLLQAGKAAEAARVADNWLQTQPKDVAVPLYLADRAMTDKRLDDAERYYLRIVKQQPNHALAYNNLAWISGELKRDAAVSYAEKANAIAPNQPAFMDTLATLLAARGDYAKAIELQTKVLKMQGSNDLFKLNMAKIYAQAGRKDEARKLLDELAQLGDKFAGQAEAAKLRATL